MPIEISWHGPVYDGRAQLAADEVEQDSLKQVAVLGAQSVRANLNTVLKVQTPYYRLRVQAQREAPGWRIQDGGVVYGPWLEGTGSRNKTTRFKGYATFRRTTQQIQAQVKHVTQAVLDRYIERMR